MNSRLTFSMALQLLCPCVGIFLILWIQGSSAWTDQTACKSLQLTGAVNQAINGYYVMAQERCSGLHVYHHNASVYYIYYWSGYWVVASALCTARSLTSGAAKVHDYARFPESIRGRWLERGVGGNSNFSMSSGLLVSCYTQESAVHSGLQVTTMAVSVAIMAVLLSLTLAGVIILRCRRRAAHVARAESINTEMGYTNRPPDGDTEHVFTVELPTYEEALQPEADPPAYKQEVTSLPDPLELPAYSEHDQFRRSDHTNTDNTTGDS